MSLDPVEPLECWAVPVVEPSQVADARRRVAAASRKAGLDDTRAGALAIVVTELGHNLVKHADRGQMMVRTVERGGVRGVEVLAVDRGPGISDVARCLRDGYSSAGTAGTGLGAIRRQSDEFDLFTMPGRGTALLGRVWAGRPSGPPEGGLELGAVCLPVPGETDNGDGWKVLRTRPPRLVVVDGLGHGALAAEATGVALRTAEARATEPLPNLLTAMHDALKATRGAVAAVAEVDAGSEQVRYAGVGNIAGAVWSPSKHVNMVSMNGTLGHAVPRIHEFAYPWPPQALLVLHTDGVSARWNLDDYPGLTPRDPSLVAAVLHRDFGRGRDDATVVVARAAEAKPWTPRS